MFERKTRIEFTQSGVHPELGRHWPGRTMIIPLKQAQRLTEHGIMKLAGDPPVAQHPAERQIMRALVAGVGMGDNRDGR